MSASTIPGHRRFGSEKSTALDAAERAAYMPAVMIRFLVTLLVLMSGLAADGAAANAQAYGTRAQIGAVETGQRTAKVAPCPAAGGMACIAAEYPRLVPNLAHPAAFSLPSLTVRPGIDRARE